jgi:hypothetical protein
MDRIIVEGVRCFHTSQSVPLKPVTLLVGENSSGKTAFLALARIAWDLCQGASLVDFNEEPFPLGSYDQVASYRGGRAGRARSFTIGAQVSLIPDRRKKSRGGLPEAVTIKGQFAKEVQPKLQEWALHAGPFEIKFEYGEEEEPSLITIIAPSGRKYIKDIPFPRLFSIPWLLSYLIFSSRATVDENLATLEGEISDSDLEILNRFAYQLSSSLGPRPYAFAPIRTRPQRTYEPLKEVPSPEGSHVPIVLARTLSSDPQGWDRLRQSLDLFGKASGLFKDVTVKRLGRKASDPFQIRVKISGPAFNLVDVGYGVSQVLPVIVDSLQQPAGSTFLLQQPEVHLHPKAQSELGSLLALLAKQQNKRFLIETHSDYIVDRVRMDVRDRDHLTPNDVSILYFEREDGSVRIHPLETDPLGNIVNPPPGYRQFFLEEERRLLEG